MNRETLVRSIFSNIGIIFRIQSSSGSLLGRNRLVNHPWIGLPFVQFGLRYIFRIQDGEKKVNKTSTGPSQDV